MKLKEFEVYTPDVIPPIMYERLEVSDRFLGMGLSISGNKVYLTTIYDHKNKKWIFGQSGIKSLIEYYVEPIKKDLLNYPNPQPKLF